MKSADKWFIGLLVILVFLAGFAALYCAKKLMSLFGKSKSKCKCGLLENFSKEADNPIRWDERMNEYYIADGKGGRIMVYYCPHCGGGTPDSRRVSFFAHITSREETRIYDLFKGIRTVADVVARFGPPDEEREFASGVRWPGRRGKPDRGAAFRGLVYKRLSPVADIVFEVGLGDTVRLTWSQKPVGKDPSGQQDIMNTQPKNGIMVFRARVLPVFVAMASVTLTGFFSLIISKEGLQGVDGGALLIGVVVGGLGSFLYAWLLTLCFTLKLTPEGVFGHSCWGIRRFVGWQEIVAVKPFRFLNLRYLRLFQNGRACPVWMPLYQAHKSEFEQELKRLAPPNSPIRSYL